MTDDLPLAMTAIHEMGETLKKDVINHLDHWPSNGPHSIDYHEVPIETRSAADELADRSSRWFNVVRVNVLPYTAFELAHLSLLLRRVVAAVKCMQFYQEYRPDHVSIPTSMLFRAGNSPQFNVEMPTSREGASLDASEAIDEVLRLVRTAVVVPKDVTARGSTRHVPDTAFILMWMDKSRPELVEVHQIVKETFAEFGIRADRADEVQHQDRITDLILERIASAEFLFADLSGERPNVYYEVGFAHARGKRPILYRRKDTALHFDLSVHNVPEYANVIELRTLLRERLRAITGRDPSK